jgi:hypothetical protein
VNDFFADSEIKFPNDDLSEKVLVWLQGESNTEIGYENYKASLKQFWERLKKNGFTKFFMIRVGYWGKEEIAAMLTRALKTYNFDTAITDENARNILCQFADYTEISTWAMPAMAYCYEKNIFVVS